jgi:predicted metal-binding protein
MAKFEKYVSRAKKLGMTDVLLISPVHIVFDIRANLKCAWGCDRGVTPSIKCDSRGTTLEERVKMVKQYSHILLLHCHDPKQLSEVDIKTGKVGLSRWVLLRLCHEEL